MRSQQNIFGMQNPNPQILITFVAAVVAVTCFTSSLFGQSVKPSDYKADQVLKSNARVNPTSKAMELSIPIGGYNGRAGNGLPVSFSYSSKVWQMETTLGGPFEFMSGTKTALAPLYAKRTAAGWSSNLGSPTIEFPPNVYEAYRIGSMYNGQMYQPMVCTSNCSSENYLIYYVKRVQIIMPDGSSHEFRQDDTIYSYGSAQAPGTQDMTGTFLSVDGSRMRLDIGTTSATLFLPDGSRYLFGTPYNGIPAHTLFDRHGNKMTFNTSTRTWTDTIGRVITDPLPHNGDSQTQTVGTVETEFPGLGSETLDVDFVWAYLKDPGTSVSVIDDPDNTSQTLYYGSDYYCTNGGAVGHYYRSGEHLFSNPESTSTWICSSATNRFNPIVLSQINLANGQSYQFKYNAYGEISKIIYPSGGYERFKYAQVGTVQPSGPSYDQANRGVTDRWISEKGDGTDEIHWQYGNSSWTTTSPDGTRTEQVVYTESENAPQPFGFGNAKTGRPYEERSYSSTNQLLARKLTDYETTGAQSGGYSEATRDLRPTKEVSIIFEPGDSNALATMSETVYDTAGNSDPAYFSSLNPKQTKTYHFIVVNASTAASANITTAAGWFSAATPATVTEIDYLYDANYKARNINGLVTETRVEDANGNVKAKSQIFYDEVGTYPLLTDVSSTRWEDPNTNYRGLVTTTKSWSDIANNLFITTHAQYDRLGNARKSWDGNGNLSQVEYSSTYDHAYPTKTISPDPDGAGAITPLETTVVYDYNTGLPTSTTDANDQTTQMFYEDPLLRPTKVVAPNGHQTITEYGAGTSEVTRFVENKSQIDETNWKEGYLWYDGLGRTTASQSVDDELDDVFAVTCYDNMGRVSKSSNPVRASSAPTCASSLEWTTNAYDTAGRLWKVTPPNSAFLETTYSLATSGSQIGTVETTVDESGKQKRTVEDALDNVIRVDEPDSSGNLGTTASPNQATVFTYDERKNLTQIVQGGQTRSFVYDALNRLKQGTNPESGTFLYTYDANGNLAVKTDARGITTTHTYDGLNRVTLRDYSGTVTPDVTYVYDETAIQNSKGKLTKVSSASSETCYTSFDANGQILASQQITEGQTYSFGYTYNLAGDLATQTYPSGKVVQTSYDPDGDIREVAKQTSGNPFVYASNFEYTPDDQIKQLRLGNGVWESTQFNSRRQATQVGLGYSATDAGLWKVNYEYGEWNGTAVDPLKNNGNLARQTITVPTIGTATGFTAVQTYTYDTLDRVKSATENIAGNQTWKQSFNFDRFGNRRFDTANTTILSSELNVAKIADPEILQSNNKFKEDQDEDSQPDYLYDLSGNITKNAREQNFTYDAENRQITATGTGLSTSYAYDGNGKRVKSQNAVNGQTTIFVYDAEGKLSAEYTIDVPVPTNPTISYLTEDALGSVRVTTNSFGEIKARRDFLPFGEELYAGLGGRNANQKYSASADDTRKKFATYQRDVETGLDFAQSRYFSAMHGRFTSPDEFKGGPDELFNFEEDASDNPTFYADLENPQSLNKYQYGYNNPYKYNDPTGHCPPVIGLVVIAGACYLILTNPTPIGPRPRISNTEAAIDLIFVAIPAGKFGGPLVKQFLKGGAKTVVKEAVKQPAKQVAKQTTKQAAKQTTVQIQRGIRTLQTRISEHKQKLKDYIKNPDKHDNQGRLKNISPEKRQQRIQGRINRLKKEIKKFENEIEKLRRSQ